MFSHHTGYTPWRADWCEVESFPLRPYRTKVAVADRYGLMGKQVGHTYTPEV